MENLRAMGRITRMLKYAVKQAKEGNKVVVYTDLHHRQDLIIREIFCIIRELPLIDKVSLIGDCRLRVRIGVNAGEIVLDIIGHNFDWVSLRAPEVRPETVTLVDHAVIERKYPAITEMLYRFIT